MHYPITAADQRDDPFDQLLEYQLQANLNGQREGNVAALMQPAQEEYAKAQANQLGSEFGKELAKYQAYLSAWDQFGLETVDSARKLKPAEKTSQKAVATLREELQQLQYESIQKIYTVRKSLRKTFGILLASLGLKNTPEEDDPKQTDMLF